MNTLNISGKPEDSLKNITTLPKDCGNNPTINWVVKFDLNLPKEEIFMFWITMWNIWSFI